ncbi:MAG TPA: hypothetical protein VL282_06970 [Tepidisphaeraceae bacterium]|nr:hypothetical protein [Tepidisphaeraceae bacterium]
MSRGNGALSRIALFVVVIVLCGVAGAWFFRLHTIPAPGHPASTQPMSQPTTVASTHPTGVLLPPPKQYMDIVLRTYPKMPTTEPLGIPLDMSDAAHLVLHDPIYICSRQDIWITHPDAPPIGTTLRRANDEQTHVVGEKLLFVHWSATESGQWAASLIVRSPEGELQWVSSARRTTIPSAAYRWDRALSWNDQIIVPTDTGVTILNRDGTSNGIELMKTAASAPATTQSADAPVAMTMFDTRGLIAWIPWDNGKTGGKGAARFVDGKWTKLDSSSGWPEKLIHLIPLLDGSIIRIARGDDGNAQVTLAVTETASVDEKRISLLVDKLSDPDATQRDRAYEELTRYGSALWPVLEKLLDNQPPETQARLRELLKGKLQPTLGALRLSPGPIQTVSRHRDGGVVLYAEAGVTIARGEDEPQSVVPAWISVRPGRAVQLLPDTMTTDLQPGACQIIAWGDEWIVWDMVQGPRRFLGNHLEPLLRHSEQEFQSFFAIDRRGRWMFRKPSSASTDTLILDPTIPDPRPRLPVWVYELPKGKAGWSKDNWPAIDRGGAWKLKEAGWEAMDESKGEQLITELPPEPETSRPSQSVAPGGIANVKATTAPATTQATPPLLVDKNGNQYFDGIVNLRVLQKDGKEITWPLPNAAAGEGKPTLIAAGDERLFLFNAPGRVLRLHRTPASTQPFELEATFTRNIPSSENINRIWLDPAGRIIIAYDGTNLAILFPAGRIPPEISKLMLDSGDTEEEQ